MCLQVARRTAEGDLEVTGQRLQEATTHIHQLQEQVATTQVCVALNTASG